MSDLSAAAAAALGIPEAIVMRSAAARAAETGMSVDEVLGAWAGGGSIDAPAAPAPPEDAASQPAEPAAEPAPPQAAPEVVIEVPAAATPIPETASPAPAPPGKPPVLIGEPDNPMRVLVAAVGLFIAILLVGLVGPSIPTENPGARSTDLPHSEAGLRGQGSVPQPGMRLLPHPDGPADSGRCWPGRSFAQRLQPGAGQSALRA